MKHRHAARETVKNIAIVLLIISAVFLGWASRLFGNGPVTAASITALMKSMAGPPAVSAGVDENKHAAGLPVTIAVTDGVGGRYGVKYARSRLDELYTSTFPVFTRALGSALTPVEADEGKWREALSSLGIYYEYLTPVSLSVLAGWYGSDIAGEWGATAVRRLFVTYEDGKNYLHFQDDATGRFYVSGTAGVDDITDKSDALDANGAVFAFENGQGSAASYTLLLPEVIEHPVLTTANPLSDNKNRADLLLSLDVNESATPSYPDPDGGAVFVTEEFTLTLSPDGTIIYHRTGNDADGALPEDPGKALELALDMVGRTIGNEKYCGQDVAVCYDSGTALADGGYRVYFRYVAFGGVVWLYPDGYAASVTVKNGVITDMELHFKTYVNADEPQELLPEVLAAAAAGSDFMLGYDDFGSGNLTPSWVRLPLQR